MLKALAAAIAICALVAPGAETTKETAHLTIKNTASADAAVPGRKVSLFVDVAPKPKMHVYAPGQPGYIAINLALDPDPAFTAARARYPAAEKLLLKILNERQLVYAKPFRISQELTLGSTPELRDRAAAGGALTIKGTLRYQACDEAICYLPVNVPVEWTLPLASAR